MAMYDLTPTDYPNGTWCGIFKNSDGAKSYSDNSDLVLKLPLPHMMTYESNFNWSSEDTSMTTTTVIDSGTDIVSNVANNIKSGGFNADTLQKTINTKNFNKLNDSYQALGLHQLRERAGKINAGGFNGEQALRYGLGKASLAYNPNKIIYFNGVPHREFTLSFDLIPQNKNKAQAMAKALKMLRVNASPSYEVGKFFFKYPSRFSMQVQINNHILLEREEFVITRMNTNFTPNGAPVWHSDGKPVAFTMELGCMETIIATSEYEDKINFMN